ncbi:MULTISPECIES: rhodanese-like domain-containing protein [Chryseobacterium]|jgi:rhodanese-related sulfurtransferase|uniref:rhodanese-like domain-containing protein n=1 Tax=Chryseobacterium TaxID=59732 RepID=UPI00115BDF5A|nr:MULTISPECIES: rhodanese-like domain-containing protein [Chryseobacterium]MCD9618595.1 rhodanese-like domain-containing protein [Chryseobacterium gleum]GEJ46887.1 rhodanese [Chryseobacterium sp. ON_d1]
MQEQIEFYQKKLMYEMDPSDLYDAFQNSTDYIAVDTRRPNGYSKEHIPSAINLPHREMTEESTQHLDKSKIYVCYCDGIGCNASTKGALKMTQLGFKVIELIGGIEWWKFDGYATAGTEPTNGSTFVCAC